MDNGCEGAFWSPGTFKDAYDCNRGKYGDASKLTQWLLP